MKTGLIKRRHTISVKVGNVEIGSEHPLRLQSMTNTATLDVEASAAQCRRIADAGADIVRLTAQGVSHARALGEIRRRLLAAGCDIPLVADIHFNPAAAFAAAEEVEKVRINPGNFADPGRTFKKLEYTDEEYSAEIERIRCALLPFIELCRSRGTAIRLGVNHGSLSDRIMSRFGDTPAGMVESAMEYLRICRDADFAQVIISIKASNVQVMVETVRLLVRAMDAEDMHFPLHLGVTEAGDGEDGRIKSAVGIGTLLCEGIGDTIRVSLSEAPEAELPAARMLADHCRRRLANEQYMPQGSCDNPSQPLVAGLEDIPADYHVCDVPLSGPLPEGKVLLRATYPASMNADEVTVAAAVDLGRLLLDGYGDAIEIQAPALDNARIQSLALGILQATRRRISRTEYIACPGCGRTLFDLQATLAKVKEATGHLKGLKIGVMGCIVNGPGEMADADFGYVGAAAGCISLYKGKECIERNIPADEALPRLINLIKANSLWVEPHK